MIKSIIARQREEIGRILNQRSVERENEKDVKKFVDKNIVKVITGIRRSGKSVLLCYF